MLNFPFFKHGLFFHFHLREVTGCWGKESPWFFHCWDVDLPPTPACM